ncbi:MULTISPECIES: Dabb family protein [unclassified Chelatococcus]|uniref:Dabb family protein n=1 Tax=unclassified Chelatococcus TaxID=2638111 RepID=UPI00030FC770|nr:MULTISPECIES: Dabb family protein [unclassified Chelatococcus]
MTTQPISRRSLTRALMLPAIGAAAVGAFAMPAAATAGGPRVRHVVLVRFATGTEQGEIEAVFDALANLRAVVPGMLGFEGGHDTSPEGLARGYTHGFVVDFADAAARDAYLAHPDHKVAGAALVALCEGGIDGILVLDFELSDV